LLQLGTHDVIDEVVSGFGQRITELYGKRAEVTINNSNFDMAVLPIAAKQLAASDADILVSVTTPASGPLASANRGIKPMVFTFVSEPADIGYTRTGSLRNTTGLSDQVDYDRVLDLIVAFVPNARRIGYLLTQSESNAQAVYMGFLHAAASKGLSIKTAVIGSSSDVRMATGVLIPDVDVFLVGGDNTVMSGIEALITAAHAQKKPVFGCDELSVVRGAVAAFSVDYHQMGRATADLAAAILGGADPNQIPVQFFKGAKLVINAKSAAILGLTLPSFALLAAQRVIRE
jgi:putative ABC transport system substrate-binding protein